MSETIKIEKQILSKWLLNNLSIEAIESELLKEGIPSDYVNAYINAYKKMKIEKRQHKAFICLVVGAFIGFLSFLLAITDLIPQFHTLNLYGGTTLAGIIIFVGLYLLFE
ncbi:MAG: hypothetical protein ACK4IK_07545 [Bacteroidia bacterium]